MTSHWQYQIPMCTIMYQVKKVLIFVRLMSFFVQQDYCKYLAKKNSSSICKALNFHYVFKTSMKAFDAKFTFVHKTIWEKSIINQIWLNSFLHRFKTFMQLIVSTFEIKYWWFNTMLLRRRSFFVFFLEKKRVLFFPWEWTSKMKDNLSIKTTSKSRLWRALAEINPIYFLLFWRQTLFISKHIYFLASNIINFFVSLSSSKPNCIH